MVTEDCHLNDVLDEEGVACDQKEEDIVEFLVLTEPE
jgi:hypothetical protein